MGNNNQRRSLFISLFFAFAFGSLITSLIQQRSSVDDDTEDTALFAYKGIDQTLETLPTKYALAYYESQVEAYDKQRAILTDAALELHLATLAAKDGVSLQEAGNSLFDLSPPTDEEVEAFYNEHKEHIGRPFFEVKAGIGQHLMQEKATAERSELIVELESKGDLVLFLVEPSSPAAEIAHENYPFKGGAEASVHIVEFADYQCPHCKHAGEKLKQVLETYGDKVKLTFMDFPINRSGISRTIAEGAFCAGQQGKFWPFHDKAFEIQSELTETSAGEIAGTLELDKTKFDECMSGSAPKEHVKFSEQEALRLGVRATPTLFINGRTYRGDFGAQLRAEVESYLP